MKPENVTFEQAPSVPIAALTALQGLRDKGRIQAGQTVLINGAAGGVGTFAVQIAKSFGAEVTGVCRTGNVEMVRGHAAAYAPPHAKQHGGVPLPPAVTNWGQIRSFSEAWRSTSRASHGGSSGGRHGGQSANLNNIPPLYVPERG